MAVTDSPGAGRVLIALRAGRSSPSRHGRATTLSACRCYGYDSYAGRQSELDTTDTGTATVYFHDRNGTLDDATLVGCQIMLQLYDPVDRRGTSAGAGTSRTSAATSSTSRAYRSPNVDPVRGDLRLPGRREDAARVFGDGGGPADVVFYEDERVDDRIIALLTDAGIVSTMRVVFTGNVDVNETLYDPDDVILQAVRDAADAELPGVANFYEDASAERFPRALRPLRPRRHRSRGQLGLHPLGGGDREDVTTGVAQIREFSYNLPRARIINSYLAWPKEDENGFEFDRGSSRRC